MQELQELQMDLQLFSVEDGDTGNAGDTVEGDKSTQQGISAEQVTAYLETEEGKRLMQPKLDSYFTNGLKTWKQNNLDKLVNEEISTRYPNESVEQKQIRELQQQLDTINAEKTRTEVLNTLIGEANVKGLPADLAKFALGATIEESRMNLMALENAVNGLVQQGVDKRIKGKDVKSFDVNPEEKDPFLQGLKKKW